MFKEVDSKMDLPKVEEEILKFWNEDKTFEKSLEQRKDAPLYSFFDGPPFATGLPHYGHILTSAMKDVVPRYWTMRGYKVPRRWGWDCHGLPIENIAEKELGITHKKQIEELGVKKFNDKCREKIFEYVSEWEKIIPRLGRWVDMKNAYKTMDLSYMESVWWVFKQLWDKGLIYEDYRSMHICPRCETTLSQSEVSEGYKVVKDLSVIAKFKIKDQDFLNQYCDGAETSFIAWTTTPWSIPTTVALAVGNDYTYVVARVGEEQVIFVGDRLEFVKKFYPEVEIVQELKGRDIVGVHYEHPFGDFYNNHPEIQDNEKVYRTYATDYVDVSEGTGIVTINGAFGEIDMNAARKLGLPIIVNVRMDGTYTEEMGYFADMNVKPIEDTQKTDVEIIKYLASHGALFAKEKYEHSYPHCWRCETPLLNYATSSWFVAVTKVKDEALELAKQINWSPKHIKEGRFGKWLEGARDWSISRQRYWASVIPIWRCDKCGEMAVFGSIADLENASGQKVTDLHKDVVDGISFSCNSCDGTMKRIPDVIDTWFDSGSMPYAQQHYPFENREAIDCGDPSALKNTAQDDKLAACGFPADYIGEGVDQTRAWFYYLHVLSTSIKHSPAFKHSIVNGIVLAEDGKKMSKRLKNYPDPVDVINKYGADALRFYLLSSPVVAAENLNFKESDMAELYRGMFRMLWNSYSFFVLYANIDGWGFKSQNANLKIEEVGSILDRWILSELNKLIDDVNRGMEKYDLMRTARLFPPFIDNLSNWYIRRSRKRFWKSENDSDKSNAYHTLYEVLITLNKLMAPFTPFISDAIFKNLTSKESVHLEDYPITDKSLINNELNKMMAEARRVVELGLAARSQAGIKVRQPLQSLKYHGLPLGRELEDIIADEVNLKEVVFTEGDSATIDLDTTITEELKLEGVAREVVRSIQALRKKAEFNVEDRIKLYYSTESPTLESVFVKMGEMIGREVLAQVVVNQKTETESAEDVTVEGEKIWFGISRD